MVNSNWFMQSSIFLKLRVGCINKKCRIAETGGNTMDTIQKWIGTESYRIANQALSNILKNIENPTYNQLMEILDCMREISGDYFVFSPQK